MPLTLPSALRALTAGAAELARAAGRRFGAGLAAIALALAILVGLAAPAHAQASASAYTSGFRWDAERQLVGQISAPANAAAPASGPYQAVRYGYSPDGQLIRIETGTLAAWQAESIAPLSWTGFTVLQTTDIAYDAVGNKASETVGAGGTLHGVTHYAYDADDRLQCTAVRMNLASLPADACALGTAGTQGADRITRNVYDAAGQVLQVRKAAGTGREQAYATYAFTANGKQQYVIDANGNRAELTYDGFDRQARWVFPPAVGPAAFNPATPATALASSTTPNATDYEQYTYDPGGNRTALRKRDGTVLAFEFDALSRMARKTVPDTRAPVLATTHTRDVFYAYDLRGLMLEARFDSAAGAEGIFTDYDRAGRVIGSTITLGGTSRQVRSCYDAGGNRTRASYSDSATAGGNCAAAWTNYVSYEYDGLNRPALVRESGSAPLRSYTYNPRGLLETELAAGGAGGGTSFTYDPVGRLQALTRNLAGTFQDNTTAFQYSPASQIVQEARSNDAYAFTARTNGSLAYTPNGLNQYAAVGAVGYCHDANGNLTADGSFVYLYDVENRLVEKRVQVGGTCTALAYTGALQQGLRYDPLGRLYEAVGPVLGTTRFLIDGDAIVAEYDGTGALLRRYVHGANGKADDPIAWYEGAAMWSANLHLLHANQQGSLVATADVTGAAQRLFKYDEYGVPQASDGAVLTADNGARFLYTGQVWLPELGMYYYKARIYAPRLGRFMQTDPIGYEDQVNLYAYVGNDPGNRVDPDGERLKRLFDLIMRGIAFIVEGKTPVRPIKVPPPVSAPAPRGPQPPPIKPQGNPTKPDGGGVKPRGTSEQPQTGGSKPQGVGSTPNAPGTSQPVPPTRINIEPPRTPAPLPPKVEVTVNPPVPLPPPPVRPVPY